MLERLGSSLSKFSRRWVPDPFVLAIVLTFVTFAAALAYAGFDPKRVLVAWVDGSGGGKGFWNLLAFGMQMCLILVTGHALATSPPLCRAFDWLATRAVTPARAIAIVAVGSMLLALVNWGLGLIAGALLAREVGRRCRERNVRVHYPLIAAAGYSGLMIWHGGLSGSAPLKVTSKKDLVEILGPELGSRVDPIALGRTIGAPGNLLANALLLVVIPFVLIRMLPKESERVPAPSFEGEAAPADSSSRTPAGRLDRSRVLAWGLSLLGLVTAYLFLRQRGIGSLDPNLLNFVFLFLGLALHGSALAYMNAVSDAARGCAGIIVQFPFYAGIMGMLQGTGLLAVVASGMAKVGGAALPAVSFYAAGLVNLFVPSGGGQWAVQGPILIQAAVDAGVDPARMVLALAYGDQWTNMLQPFWALPLLGIAKVSARDIIGYTVVILLVGQIPFLLGLYVGW